MTTRATASKYSVSIPAELANFLECYQRKHGLSSRSEVVTKGLEKLKEAELAAAYKDHAQHWQRDPDKEFWDSAALDDGLDTGESNW